MADPTAVHSTFVIERRFPLSPARVFAAFADEDQKRAWYVDGWGNDGVEYALDFRQGGTERSRYRMGPGTPIAGKDMASEVAYLEVQDGRRIVFSQTMALDGRVFSAALITLELAAEGDGCRLVCTHQGAFLEGGDGPGMREHGWNALFDRLARALAS